MLHLLPKGLIFLALSTSSAAQYSAPSPPSASSQENLPAPADKVIPFEFGKGIKAPKLINYTEAVYPQLQDGEHIPLNGNCLIGLVVDTAGMPQEIHTIRCTNMAFSKNSADAVSTYRFEPARKNDGTPVEVQIHVEVKFRRSPVLSKLNFCQPDGTSQPIFHLSLNTSEISAGNEPDKDGFYQLNSGMAPPKLARFEDKGFC